jgi:hypothetical protein
MASMLLPRVIDGGRANLDTLGITYVALAIIYTLFVSGELFLLYRQRSAFCVRIRNIRVVFAAVSLLHIYLILVLLVYPWNGIFPCSAEFWIMALFLPSGMAFFQGKAPAQTSHFTYTNTLQHATPESSWFMIANVGSEGIFLKEPAKRNSH